MLRFLLHFCTIFAPAVSYSPTEGGRRTARAKTKMQAGRRQGGGKGDNKCTNKRKKGGKECRKQKERKGQGATKHKEGNSECRQTRREGGQGGQKAEREKGIQKAGCRKRGGMGTTGAGKNGGKWGKECRKHATEAGGGAEEGAATAPSPLLLLLPLLPKGRSQEGRGRSCREGEQSHQGKNYQTSILGGAKRHQTCGGSNLSALLRVVLPSGNRCGGFLCPVVRDARKDRQRPPSPRCCRNPAPKFLPSAERARKATRVKTIKIPS